MPKMINSWITLDEDSLVESLTGEKVEKEVITEAVEVVPVEDINMAEREASMEKKMDNKELKELTCPFHRAKQDPPEVGEHQPKPEPVEIPESEAEEKEVNDGRPLSLKLDESLFTEDTEKEADGDWVNKGKHGKHGEFKTKKEADAQRKAMFANGYQEACMFGGNKELKEGTNRDALNSELYDDLTDLVFEKYRDYPAYELQMAFEHFMDMFFTDADIDEALDEEEIEDTFADNVKADLEDKPEEEWTLEDYANAEKAGMIDEDGDVVEESLLDDIHDARENVVKMYGEEAGEKLDKYMEANPGSNVLFDEEEFNKFLKNAKIK